VNAFPSPTRRVLLLAALAALAARAAAPAFAETAPLRAGGPTAAPPPSAPARAAAGGKVLETMNAGNYTYARVKTADGETWVAGPETTLSVDDAVEWPGGMEMKKFTSKTLGRTFESILFVDRLVVSGSSPSAAASSPAASGAAPHASLSGKTEDGAKVGDIARLEGGLTVAEIYDRRVELDGKEVALRGRVVKFNAGVMDRNWIHLRDGSTSKDERNDLTVTSSGTASVGNIVVVRGRVVREKDFGFGYRYDVMLEGAAVTVE
jgi:hypothetical protein